MAKPTLVLVPAWPSGHLMSMLEAGKRLQTVLDVEGGAAVSITVLVMQPPTPESSADVAARIREVEAAGLDVCFHYLPAVELPTDWVGVEEFVSRYIEAHAQVVKAAIAGLSVPVAALVLDFFATMMFDVARELDMPAYVYFSSTAALLGLMLRLPALHVEVTVEFEEMDGGVDVPGMSPVPPVCLPVAITSKKSPNYTWFMYHGNRFVEAEGIIINTAAELEPGVLVAITDGRCVPGRPMPPVYPIGPTISLHGKKDAPSEPHECVKWLDTQPPASVVFLCFGSMGFLDATQVHEIAVGLERSGHRFLWALRAPPAPGSRHPLDAKPEEMLPEGFLERTKGRGLVWPTWAPQKEILSHAAVGGFVTHCGWNSVLESLWFGVPLIPWPLYAEQHLNAFELVVDMGVAVKLKVDRKKNNFVEAAELERAVRSLMGESDEGRRAREKAMEMKAACRKAVEKGGSSYAALQSLAAAIRRI